MLPRPYLRTQLLLGVKLSRRSLLKHWRRSASTSPSLSLPSPNSSWRTTYASLTPLTPLTMKRTLKLEAMLLAEMKALEEDEDDFLENLLIQELKKDSSASDSDSDSDFDDLF
ncbi:hypothetical protein L596_016630 [Steinernema carpocapsae]|uniref:Uncharacterized protein n=1 Tax=Steinernema carpocapsae TaxID=34508 RepID=A0A4U5NJM5_STECR|nr:hypothetical protein L596_016630 [Steinernema carpocapsae]